MLWGLSVEVSAFFAAKVRFCGLEKCGSDVSHGLISPIFDGFLSALSCIALDLGKLAAVVGPAYRHRSGGLVGPVMQHAPKAVRGI